MPFLVKFKALFKKNKDEEQLSLRAQVVSSPKSKYASLIALANAARGRSAEEFFPHILLQAAHHRTVVSLRAPTSRGALAVWIEYLLHQGTTIAEINSILRIECAQEESHNTTSPSTSIIETGYITERDAVTNLMELSSDVDLTLFSSPSLSDTVNDEASPPLSGIVATTTISSSITTTAAKPTLQQFSLLERLGEGAFGTVFLARHKPSGIRVALKAISKVPHGEGSTGNLEWSEGILEERARCTPGNETWAVEASALAECCALRRTRGEKGILQIHAAFHDLRYFYIATAYQPCGDLSNLLRYYGVLPASRVRFYAADLLLGLETLRKHGIVHRDLKPANLLIGLDGHLVIADLGLSRSFGVRASDIEMMQPSAEGLEHALENTSENTISWCGTPQYIAPEVYRRQEYSYPADMWAVGVIVYQLLLGRTPWDGLVWKHNNEIGRTIVNEPVVVSDVERVQLNLNAQAEQFFLEVLDKDQRTRPTPAQLKSHAFFTYFDWERHSSRAALACWIPGARDEHSPGEKGPFITGTRVYEPDEDPYPHLAFLSPFLSSGCGNSSTSTLYASQPPPSESFSSHNITLPSPQVSSSISLGPTSLLVPGVEVPQLASPACTSQSTTVIGSLAAPSTSVSSTTVNSSLPSATRPSNGALTKVKTWVRKVWRGLKANPARTRF